MLTTISVVLQLCCLPVRCPMGRTGEKVERLITDYFPWGPEGAPVAVEGRRGRVFAWLRDQTAPFRATATTLMARIVPILDDLREGLMEPERARFFARVDTSHVVKSPESILEKMARRWTRPEDQPPPI